MVDLSKEFLKLRAELERDKALMNADGAYARAMLTIYPAVVDFLERERRLDLQGWQTVEGVANLTANLVFHTLLVHQPKTERLHALDRVLAHINKLTRAKLDAHRSPIMLPKERW